MTVARAYRSAVWLPLALPVLAWLGMGLGMPPTWFGPVAVSGVVSVPVCAVMLAVLWHRIIRMSASELERLFWVLPVAAVPLVIAGTLIWVSNEPTLASHPQPIMLIATGLTLAVGYGYVFLFRIIGRMVKEVIGEREPHTSVTRA